MDADETVAKLMNGNGLDDGRFKDVVGTVLAQAASGGRGVRAFGEMVTLLWRQGDQQAALRVEELWNQLGSELSFSLLCAYPIGDFRGDRDLAAFSKICREHSVVVPAESFSSLANDDERTRTIADLQRRAAAIETEIAERMRAEEALRRARDEAEAANRAKDEFVALLGHELRNPLSSVQNAIISASLDPEYRDRGLEIARRGADQLGQLVDDLLDVARVTQGRVTLRMKPLSFSEIVECAVDAKRRLLELRSLELELSLPKPDAQIVADATRLEQVIVNLIDNAAKYTDCGGRITIVGDRVGNDVRLRVRDNGIGIAPDLLPRVFELFAQADRTLDRARGGLGIGLSIVKRLVELHGGSVQAHSEGIGRGSEFVVLLPAVAARAELLEEPAPVPAANGCLRMLVVDDNRDAADSLRIMLELHGHRVDVAYDGVSALAAARSSSPDLMLVDIGLPGMDGYELARCIREEESLRTLYLVATTGYGRESDRQRALAAGFDRHVTKPIRLQTIQRIIEAVGSGRS